MTDELPRWRELTGSAREAVTDLVELFADRATCKVAIEMLEGGKRDFSVKLTAEGLRRARKSSLSGRQAEG